MKTTPNDQTDFAPGNEQKNNRRIFIKENQLVTIGYENPKPDGHKETLMDSYRNLIGRIYEIYDEQTGKFEYTFKDSEGTPLFKSEELSKLKEEISKHKTVMLEKAHQRRIEKKKQIQKEPTVAEQYRRKKTILEKANKQAREITSPVHDFVDGEETTREKELGKIRQQKGQDREISR